MMALNLSPSPSVVTTQEDALAVVEELMEHIKVYYTHRCSMHGSPQNSSINAGYIIISNNMPTSFKF